MKKISKLVLCFALLGSISGCAKPDERIVDEKFVDSLQEGLDERWELADTTDYSTDSFNKYLDAELNKIQSFKKEKFENQQLKEQADLYIDSLEKTKGITKYIDSNDFQFQQLYSPLYSQRVLALQEINKIDPLQFDNEEDQEDFDNLLEEADLLKSVIDLTNGIQFEKVKEDDEPEYDLYTADYEAKVTNDTNYQFDYYNLTINLLDKDGVVLEQTFASVNSWKIGETQRLSFMVAEKIEKVQIASADYSVNNNAQTGTINFE